MVPSLETSHSWEVTMDGIQVPLLKHSMSVEPEVIVEEALNHTGLWYSRPPFTFVNDFGRTKQTKSNECIQQCNSPFEPTLLSFLDQARVEILRPVCYRNFGLAQRLLVLLQTDFTDISSPCAAGLIAERFCDLSKTQENQCSRHSL